MSIDLNQKIPVHTPSPSNETKTVTMPKIFDTKVRNDLILFAFKNMRMNRRQPYGTAPLAGKKVSARSWGTGRAKARVPRIKGGGSRRSGQGAAANFCRGGRHAFGITVQRKWNRQTPLSLRRITCAMGVAATADPNLVQSRGHVIDNLKNIPIVVSDNVSEIIKTSESVQFLENLGLKEELEKKSKKTIRAGKGKARSRKYKKKAGVLLIHNLKNFDSKKQFLGFRNIPGVEVVNMNSLSVLSLCPGGAAGRLVIWTESAFEALNEFEELKLENYCGEVVSSESAESEFYSEEVQQFIGDVGMLKVPQKRRGNFNYSKI